MSSQSDQPNELRSFNLPEVDAAIAGTQFAGALHYLATTPSTNDLAHAAAHAGARHGVWIAGQQTAGRGRGGHSWHSPAGAKDAPAGLYMTALISPDLPMQSAQHLSLSAAIAVQSAIASVTGFRIREDIDIRWPNDLMFNMPNRLNDRDGTARKLGGILIEASAQPAPASGPALLRYAVVGIGINVNHTAFPPELEVIATSLRLELSGPAPTLGAPSQAQPEVGLHAPIRCEPLAAAILIALDREINRLTLDLAPGALHPSQDFTELSTWITGKRVRVEARDPAPNDPAPGYTGVTAGLDPNGFLLVNGDDGQLHTVLSGGLREPTDN
jgi:BirA family biotin operon repressor/biotin-[acetyl-CoA-carboxylase] ligase